MKINKIIKRIILISTIIVVISSCMDYSEHVLEHDNLTEASTTSRLLLMTSHQGYFEWDNVSNIIIKTQSFGDISITLPWIAGSSELLGVPREFICQNYLNPDPKKRTYSRENGWELIYSNMNVKSDNNKYFGLYNKYSGILRFFFYGISIPSVSNTNSTFVDIKINGSNSLLNFTSISPYPQSQTFATTHAIYAPSINFSQQEGVGYQQNKWYAAEFELAYDPIITNNATLDVYVRSLSTTIGTAEGTIKGSITGSIVSQSPSPDVNLNFDFGNTTNNNINNNLSVKIDNNTESIASAIDSNVSNSGFWNKLWNNVKDKAVDAAGKGAKDGVLAIFSGGSSAVTKFLGGMLGFSGSTTTTSKVDLITDQKINIKYKSETKSEAWGDIKKLTLPGTQSMSGAFGPIYNERLGVWNLKEGPKWTPYIYIYIWKSRYGI